MHFRHSLLGNHSSRAAFTLLELVIVMMLLGIIAMLGLPVLNSAMGDSRLTGAAQEVVNALEFAQLSAMTTGNKTRVTIEILADKIYVRRYQTSADLFGGGNTLPAASVENETWKYMEYPLKKGTDYVIDFIAESRFKGVDITWSDFHVFNPVYFDALGNPSHGGSNLLVLGNRQKVVTLDAVSGKVTVSP